MPLKVIGDLSEPLDIPTESHSVEREKQSRCEEKSRTGRERILPVSSLCFLPEVITSLPFTSGIHAKCLE